MKIILTADVPNLGAPGDIVEVKDGYGRNYLLPEGKAIRWSRGTEKQIEGIKRARDAREVRGVEHAQGVVGAAELWVVDWVAEAQEGVERARRLGERDDRRRGRV